MSVAWSLVFLNAGLAGVFITILFSSPWKSSFALVVLGGLFFYGRQMTAILRARKRHNLDWGLKYFLTTIALLRPYRRWARRSPGRNYR